jgi:hypothetical protein
MLDIGMGAPECHVEASIVALPVLVFPPIEIETGLESTEAIVEFGAVAAKDTDCIAVTMAPSADDPPPHAVGHVVLSGS